MERLDGSAIDDYHSKLAALYPDSLSTIKRSIEFIERLVQSTLEYRAT
jgi:hypothetical protein